MRAGRILAVVLSLAGPLAARATDAPHDASWAGTGGAVSCQDCHMAHFALGSSLTAQGANYNLCDSCHKNLSSFGFPWSPSHQAVAGTSGKSHRWDAAATNLGATPPSPNATDATEAAMGKRLSNGNLQCSTCHDQHQSDVFTTDASIHTSLGHPSTLPQTIACSTGCGTGTLQLSSVPANAKSAGYVLKVAPAGAYKISHDNGLSWFGYGAGAWGPDTNATYANGRTYTAGTATPLDDGVTMVTFGATGTFPANATFASFYVGRPYLRGDNTASKMCVTCHRDRNQRYQDVEGGPGGNLPSITLGQTVFSHPVGQALGANGGGYDRAQAAVLSATGGTQTGVATDLDFSAGGVVHCLSCHAPHNADSNSLTSRPR